MNIQQFDTFIDATNKFSIEDLVNNVNTGNVGIGGTTASLNQFLFITSNSNLYLANSNIDSEIRFKVKNNINNPNYNPDYTTKIDKNGKLQVYHQYNLLQPTFSSGFYDVEYELLSLKADGITADLQLTALEASIVGLQLEIIAIDEYATNVNNSFAAFAEKLTPGIPTTPLSQNIQQQLQNIGTTYSTIRSTTQTKLEKYLAWGIYATAGALIGYAGYNAFANNAYEGVDNITYSNIPPYTPEEKNMLRRSIIDQQESNVSNYYNTHSNLNLIQGFINSNTFATQYIKYLNSDEIKINNTNVSNIFVASNVLSNINLNSGFINSNQTNQQIIPIIKTNKLMIGNITNPNNVYNLESTGDININELYRNNVSLTSTLNTKQGNLTFNNPLLNTIDIITLKRDASLTLDGSGNLSVVKTATNPIVITGNNFSLNYDTNTLGLNGTNQITVLAATSSKWTTNGTSIYNNNTGNIGIGSQIPQYKLDVLGTTRIINKLSVCDSSAVSGLFERNLNVIGADAVQRIWRYGSTNAPAIELMWKATTPTSSGDYTYYWDVYLKPDNGSFVWRDRTVEAERMSISSSGNVGINIITPQQKLSVGGIAEICNANLTKLIFSYDTANGYRHSILTAHDGGISDNNSIDFNVWRYGQTSTTLGDKLLTRFHSKYTQFYGNRYMFINERTLDNGNKNYTLTPLSVFHQTQSSSTVLNDPQPVLNLARQGTSAQTYGQNACFKLSRWQNSGTNSKTRMDMDLSDGANDDVNVMTLRSDRRVGIDNTNPAYKLDVSGDINFTGNLNKNGSIYIPDRSYTADDAANATFRIRSPSESTASSLNLGTPANSSAANKVSIIAQGISSYSRSDLHICLNNTADNSVSASITDARITIKPSGNIGFGNSVVPTQASSATSYFLHLGNSQTSRIEDWNICFHKSNGNGGTRMFNIGYTEDDQGYNFYECLGDIGNNNTFSNWMYHFAVIYSAPDYCCIINNQGNMTLHGQFYPYSDEKIKTDIETIDNALDKIGDLRGVYYTDIIHQERKIGVIAQEVEMVIPEVVITEILTDTKAINYNGLVGLLIEGIKELKVINDRQQEQINNLIKRIEILENK